MNKKYLVGLVLIIIIIGVGIFTVLSFNPENESDDKNLTNDNKTNSLINNTNSNGTNNINNSNIGINKSMDSVGDKFVKNNNPNDNPKPSIKTNISEAEAIKLAIKYNGGKKNEGRIVGNTARYYSNKWYVPLYEETKNGKKGKKLSYNVIDDDNPKSSSIAPPQALDHV